ncbi:MAG: hypothetical protein ABI132_11485, partial [Rhodanobacteraceae bacterium]
MNAPQKFGLKSSCCRIAAGLADLRSEIKMPNLELGICSPDLRCISAAVAIDETRSGQGESPRNRRRRDHGDESSAVPTWP